MAKSVLVSTLSHKLEKKITIKDIDTVMIVYNAAHLIFWGFIGDYIRNVISIIAILLINIFFLCNGDFLFIIGYF